MPARQEPKESGTVKSIKLHGIYVIPMGLPSRWGIKTQINLGFTICWVMSMNGAGTCLGIIRMWIRKIGVDPNQAPTYLNRIAGLPQAVLGTARRRSAHSTSETTATPIPARNGWAFALLCLCNPFLLYHIVNVFIFPKR
jgi:hypothetical protein